MKAGGTSDDLETLAALAEQEARAYAAKPATKDERDALAALDKAQERVLDDLAKTDRW